MCILFQFPLFSLQCSFLCKIISLILTTGRISPQLWLYWVCTYMNDGIMHQSIPAAPSHPPPPATAGHLPALSVPGVGHLQILHCPGTGHLPTPGQFLRFWHALSYQNTTTQKVLLEKKQIGSSVKDRNKLKRVVKACSQFYACISSLLIKQEFIHSENRSYPTELALMWINVFWLLNQISSDIIWRT